MPTAILTLAFALLCFTTGADAASRKACKPSACRTEIGSCKAACTGASKRAERRCRKRCKGQVTRACRADTQACGGGNGGGQCTDYAAAADCAPLSFEPLRQRNSICLGAAGAAQPCDADHDTKFRVRTPWATQAGECCVVDTCRGATAFGVYNNLGLPPGSPLATAPVIVTAQSLSTYFQKPPLQTGSPGQWNHYAATIVSFLCATPPAARVINTAGGPLVARNEADYLSYDTRPVPPPTGTWDFLDVAAGASAVSFAPPYPPALPYCGSAGDTLTCQPRVFQLDLVNSIGDPNPIVEVLSERISLDKLCDDTVFASAEATFRRQDDSTCSVQIFGKATIGCTSDADCSAGEVCTTTDPTSPGDFGNAFPGWTGKSCVVPVP